MNNLKKLIGLGLAAMLAVSSSAVVMASESEATASGEKVRIAALINTDGLAVWYADKMGYFDEVGITDREISYFVNGVLENEALAADAADIGFNGFAGVYPLATGDYTMVADCDDGKGLVTYVNPECPVLEVQGEYPGSDVVYGNAETAAGLSFGATLGTIQQIMVDTYYSKLEQDDYSIVSMDAASCYNALLNGEIDGAALTMNYCAAADEAGMVRLGTYEDITGAGTGSTVVVPNSYLESNHDDIVLVLKAVYKALDEIQNDEQLEFDQGMEFFKEQGSEYSETEMWTEIETRDLYSYDLLKDLQFGKHVVFSAVELTKLGLLEEGSAQIVADSINPDLLTEATGVEVTKVIPELE